jgi:hypothetical protein
VGFGVRRLVAADAPLSPVLFRIRLREAAAMLPRCRNSFAEDHLA